jgi:hypothetical protein
MNGLLVESSLMLQMVKIRKNSTHGGGGSKGNGILGTFNVPRACRGVQDMRLFAHNHLITGNIGP